MWVSLLVGSFLMFCTARTQSVCGRTPVVWRNYNITCPERAVCADVFLTPRDWYNGTRCEEERTLHNCLCPGNTVCPYTNPSHRLHATAQHLQYTCRPMCSLPYCGNINLTSSDSRNPLNVAQTVEQNAPEFGDRTYYRMGCRCPRHHVPYVSPPGVHRAVQMHSRIYNYLQHKYTTRFICKSVGDERSLPDPCVNHSISEQ